ncbi:MAG: Gfo/Idh/MocA family oxidoreductase [Planctomycetia bacterium]|nr:MAG: Gfo/Idh/MocA family oxidoreductase [Planctomycetia bacterium]
MSPEDSESSEPATLRGAMLGTGSIAQHHLLAWRDLPGVDIVALANRTRWRAARLGETFGVGEEHIYSDYTELLAKESLDFVDIATAPLVHCEQVLAAAERGLHVFCQKPFATSTAEARTMVEACEGARVRCIVNENWRWRSYYRRLKQMVDDQIVGQPRYARFCFHGDDVLPRPDGGLPALFTRQVYTAEMPRLILLEWGIHLVDVLRFLFGDIRAVFASMARISPLVQGEDLAVVQMRFANGMVGLIDISWASATRPERRMTRGQVDPFWIEGDRGTIQLDPFQDDALLVTSLDGNVVVQPAHPHTSAAGVYQESYLKTQSHFIDCLRSGRPAENEARDNLKTLAAVMAAYESAERGEVVHIAAD